MARRSEDARPGSQAIPPSASPEAPQAVASPLAEAGDGPAPRAPGDEPGGFEACLVRLEALVDHLERSDLPLEQALAAFEEGVALTRRCAEQLDRAERRVDVLVKQGRELVERPFAPGDEGE